MRRGARIGIVALLAAVAPVACRPSPPHASSTSADAHVRALADAYLHAYFDRNPEAATFYGVDGAHHDRLTDNSLSALRAWEAREDRWGAEVRGIDATSIRDPRLAATYAILRHALESAQSTRVCRAELWDVSHMDGWYTNLAYIATIQPVGTDAARRDALARWAALPAYVDTDIANLREGLKQGYSAPRTVVRIVIEQVRALAATPVAESPFDSPAVRDGSPAFRAQFDAIVRDRIVPAATRYADFLEHDYLGAARESIGVSANPHGAECYTARIESYSSVAKSAAAVHALGLRQMDQIASELQAAARRSYHTDDWQALFARWQHDPATRFRSREDVLAYSQAALDRARAAAPRWFGTMPMSDVKVEPYPAFREKTGPNEYNAPAADGSHPGVFYVNTYDAPHQSRVTAEDVAFHETIPGHHLQVALALEQKDIHPIGRYLGNSGYSEGWGLYAERLADEMHLYSSDMDRMGMLSSQAFRAGRLVVDTGIHAMGWSRAMAIDYLATHTGMARERCAAEVDRYIATPGQATSYMLGMLEIRAARDEAQEKLGSRFDIRAFHDQVLKDGAVPLSYLREKIRNWIRRGGGS